MMLRRLLYREPRFDMLEEDKLRRLHSAFAAMVEAYPRAYYWIHRIDQERTLVLDFFHQSMLRYRGLEMVLIERGTVSYFRLPGAKVGGTGCVPPGDYRVRIESPTGTALQIDVRKNAVSRLDLLQCLPCHADAAEREYPTLPRHILEPSKFADEMRQAIASGIEWIYRNYRHAGPPGRTAIADDLRNAAWPTEVEGVCRDADAYLWLLKRGCE